MVMNFAIVGACVALIPTASFLLIPMELFMIYKIAAKHDAFEFFHFVMIAAAFIPISAILKGLVSTLHVIVGLGQLVNAAVAFTFILVLGALAEKHYGGRAGAQQK